MVMLVQVWEKATEIPEAIRKGKEDAMKKMIEITFDENGSITHDVLGKIRKCIRTSVKKLRMVQE